MKKLITICAIFGLILAASGTAQGGATVLSSGNTYATIQEAVANSINNDTINVSAGTYTGMVSVDKPLSILGAGAGTTVLNSGADFGFSMINVNSVTISGFSVTANSPGQAIWLDTSSNSLIENNIVYGTGSGIRLVGNFGSYNGNQILNNTVYDSTIGISLNTGSGDDKDYDSIGNLVEGNTVYNTGNAIRIDAGYGNENKDNVIRDNMLYNNSSAAIAAVTWNWGGSPPGDPYGIFSNISITGNDISFENYGIYLGSNVDATGFNVNYNNIVGTTVYLAKNNGDGTLDATYNWWGDPAGPNPAHIIGDVDVGNPLGAPIPAPGAILLGAIGVGLVGWLKRRRTL